MTLAHRISVSPLFWCSIIVSTAPTWATAPGSSILFGPNIAHVPATFSNVFPFPNFNRSLTSDLWQVDLLGASSVQRTGLQGELDRLGNISFIAFQPSFYDLLGVANYTVPMTLETIFTFPAPAANTALQLHDATVYSPEANAIFCNQFDVPTPSHTAPEAPFVWRINLNDTPPTTSKVYPHPPLVLPNGGYHHDRSIYWVQQGNFTTPSAIVKMDPLTLETSVVLNNFHGYRFNSLDDIVIRDSTFYVSDTAYGHFDFNSTTAPVLATGVYAWHPATGAIRSVANSDDGSLQNPNGLALTPDLHSIYVADWGLTTASGPRTIFKYDVGPGPVGTLLNKRVFAYGDSGAPDGIKTDRAGNVYGGVASGVDVWDAGGVLLGKMVMGGDLVTNMWFVGKELYMTGSKAVYRVRVTTGGWID